MKPISFGIYTLGCRVNQYESDRLHALLVRKGMVAGDFSEKCDVYLINTCTVTSESDRKCRQMIRRAHQTNPDAKIYVCGCFSEMFPEEMKKFPFVTRFIGTRDKDSLVNMIAADLSLPPLSCSEGGLILPQTERARAFIKIEDGCDNRCAYCIIPFARHEVVSRGEDNIVAEAALIAKDRKEIVLTGIETASYGKDRRDVSLLSLFSKLSAINGIERIRCGSLEPTLLSPSFVDAVADFPKVMPFYHLSMQSGSDSVLRRMRRRYNTAQVKEKLQYLNQKIEKASYAYDLIVGFPGETEEEFTETLDFVSQTQPIRAHIFTYSRRKGTEAEKMNGQIPEEVKIARSKALSSLCEEIAENKVKEEIKRGTEYLLLTEQTKNGITTGHTENFLTVSLKKEVPPNTLIKIVLTEWQNGQIFADPIE